MSRYDHKIERSLEKLDIKKEKESSGKKRIKW